MFDVFSRLGKWLLATLRGSEDGTESGTLHILRTDSDGRLVIVTTYSDMVLSDLDNVDATVAPGTGIPMLYYNSTFSEWQVFRPDLADLADVDDSLSPGEGELLIYDANTDSQWEGLPLGGIAGSLFSRGSAPAWAGNVVQFKLSAVDDTPQTLIADGPTDVTAIFVFLYAVHAVTGGDNAGGYETVEPGNAVTLYDDGTDSLTLTCASDGSVTVERAGGSDTFNVLILGGFL